MEVKLTPELERCIAEQVESGRFADAGVAIRSAVHLLRIREEYEMKLRDLREELRVTLAGLDGGGVGDSEEALSWLAETLGGPGCAVDESAIVREGLALLQREDARSASLEALRRDVQAGLDDIERGDLLDGEEVFREVLGRIAAHDEARV